MPSTGGNARTWRTVGISRRWAATLEHHYFGLRVADLESGPSVLPHARIQPPRQFGLAWTKTEALTLLYWAAIGGWLVIGLYTLVA